MQKNNFKYPNLIELPPPPHGKTGWPWTVETDQLREAMPDGSPWPRISIVTPNYNYGRFLEEAIRSVLLQGYPNLEYIVVDGGSTDNSVKIIKKYEKWITYWTSQKDGGQACAINNGFQRASGEIMAWLNSDDFYEEGAFFQIAKEFIIHPEVDVISGRCRLWQGRLDDKIVGPSPLRNYEDFLKVGSNWMNGRLILQPEAFFKRRAYDLSGGIPEDLKYSFDVALWMRMVRKGCKFLSTPRLVSNLRLHKDQKTTDLYEAYAELCKVAWKNLQEDLTIFGDSAFTIADDIFSAMGKIHLRIQEKLDSLKTSTSYQVGRLLTGLKFW